MHDLQARRAVISAKRLVSSPKLRVPHLLGFPIFEANESAMRLVVCVVYPIHSSRHFLAVNAETLRAGLLDGTLTTAKRVLS